MNDKTTKTREDRAAETWEQYEQGKRFQASIALDATIRENIDFYEGRQWGRKVTDRTKMLPRPVTNFVRMIVNNKMSAMNNKPCRITYEADSQENDSIEFTQFSDYQFKEMGAESVYREAIYNGAIKGTYLFHVYWDAQAKGKKGKVTGALRMESLDPRNVIFCDPSQKDEQKQKYIIISTREEVEAIRSTLPKGIDKKLIVADDEDVKKSNNKTEQDGTEMCTVLVKYFKIDGEVYCEKSVRGTVIRDAFPLRPEYEKVHEQIFGKKVDEANGDTPDNTSDTEEEPLFSAYTPTMYPLAVGQYIPREDCIYGISEVEGLIPNQRCFNFSQALQLLQAQNESWSKWIVKPNALGNQKITNEPGQIIVDNSTAGDGIKRVAGGAFNSAVFTLTDNLLSYTRTVVGATEVMNGESISANMSGAAIAQLQSQAQLPNEENRKAFWRVLEKVGRIAEQFYRMYYYDDTEYKVRKSNESGAMTMENAVFSAKKYNNTEFTVVAKVTSGTTSSPAGDITVIDQLKAEGLITTRQWLEAYPEDALSDKNHLLELIKQAEYAENMQLKIQLAERDEQIKALIEQCEKSKNQLNAVSQIAGENEKLRGDLALAFNENRKEKNTRQQAELAAQQYHNDASDFAQIIANAANANIDVE
jgi:hypothetical protein|nr:MAG TPA: portal protein [Caudoviricetes sp.]